jgi:deferrochelatase/peroxidase EfeB
VGLLNLDEWDSSTLQTQEETIGREKGSGAPLGGRRDSDPADLEARSPDGGLLVPETAHIRVANPATNGGKPILRRSYSFVDGIDPKTGGLDAGLFFVAFQRDPVRQFLRVQQWLSHHDALGEFTVHTGSAIFAVPPGARPGGYVGEGLFAT